MFIYTFDNSTCKILSIYNVGNEKNIYILTIFYLYVCKASAVDCGLVTLDLTFPKERKGQIISLLIIWTYDYDDNERKIEEYHQID